VAELVALVAVSLAGAAAGLALLSPLAGRLLDEDATRLPALRLTVPPEALLVTAAAAVAATVAASALAVLRTRSREEEAYRDDG
jgi:hypothetical protein